MPPICGAVNSVLQRRVSPPSTASRIESRFTLAAHVTEDEGANRTVPPSAASPLTERSPETSSTLSAFRRSIETAEPDGSRSVPFVMARVPSPATESENVTTWPPASMVSTASRPTANARSSRGPVVTKPSAGPYVQSEETLTTGDENGAAFRDRQFSASDAVVQFVVISTVIASASVSEDVDAGCISARDITPVPP